MDGMPSRQTSCAFYIFEKNVKFHTDHSGKATDTSTLPLHTSARCHTELKNVHLCLLTAALTILPYPLSHLLVLKVLLVLSLTMSQCPQWQPNIQKILSVSQAATPTEQLLLWADNSLQNCAWHWPMLPQLI